MFTMITIEFLEEESVDEQCNGGQYEQSRDETEKGGMLCFAFRGNDGGRLRTRRRKACATLRSSALGTGRYLEEGFVGGQTLGLILGDLVATFALTGVVKLCGCYDGWENCCRGEMYGEKGC